MEKSCPDSVVGWSWLFPPYRWHFGAVAVEQTAVIEFNAPAVRGLMADDHELGHELTARFMRVVVDRLQATRIGLLELRGHRGSCATPTRSSATSWSGGSRRWSPTGSGTSGAAW